MKNTKTAIKELTAMYRNVLLKCFIAAGVVFVATGGNAEVTDAIGDASKVTYTADDAANVDGSVAKKLDELDDKTAAEMTAVWNAGLGNLTLPSNGGQTTIQDYLNILNGAKTQSGSILSMINGNSQTSLFSRSSATNTSTIQNALSVLTSTDKTLGPKTDVASTDANYRQFGSIAYTINTTAGTARFNDLKGDALKAADFTLEGELTQDRNLLLQTNSTLYGTPTTNLGDGIYNWNTDGTFNLDKTPSKALNTTDVYQNGVVGIMNTLTANDTTEGSVAKVAKDTAIAQGANATFSTDGTYADNTMGYALQTALASTDEATEAAEKATNAAAAAEAAASSASSAQYTANDDNTTIGGKIAENANAIATLTGTVDDTLQLVNGTGTGTTDTLSTDIKNYAAGDGAVAAGNLTAAVNTLDANMDAIYANVSDIQADIAGVKDTSTTPTAGSLAAAVDARAQAKAEAATSALKEELVGTGAGTGIISERINTEASSAQYIANDDNKTIGGKIAENAAAIAQLDGDITNRVTANAANGVYDQSGGHENYSSADTIDKVLDILTGSDTTAGSVAEAKKAGTDAQEMVTALENGQVKTNTQNIEQHETRIEKAEATIGEHTTQIAGHETRITDAEATIDEHTTQIAGHETRIGAAETTIVQHTEQLAGHETRITDAEKQITQNTNDIGVLNADVDTVGSVQNTVYTQAENAKYSGTQVAAQTTRAAGDVTIGQALSATTTQVNTLTKDLADTKKRYDARFARMENKIDDLEDDMKQGLASNAALASLVPMSSEYKTQISMGMGGYQDKQGLALGAFHYATDNLMLNAGAAWSGDSSYSYKVGATFGF